MARFNLDEYETVKERKKRFYNDHEDGRIVVEKISGDTLDYAEFKAFVYLNKDDQISDAPRGTGHALEVRDTELKQGKNGPYESVNYSSWTENCEESAVGRALDNAGYASNGKPSREEMKKAQSMNKTMKNYNEGVNKADVELVQAVLDIKPDDQFVKDVASKLKQYKKLTDGQRKIFKKILDEAWEGEDKSS